MKLATRAEAVKTLHLPSPRALDRLVEKGAPGPHPGKRGGRRYDVGAIRAWVKARRAKTAPMLDLTAERAKLAKVQTHLTSLRIRQLRGQLVSRETVKLLDAARQASVRAAVLRFPTDAVLRGVPVEHETVLRGLAEEILRDLASEKWGRG